MRPRLLGSQVRPSRLQPTDEIVNLIAQMLPFGRRYADEFPPRLYPHLEQLPETPLGLPLEVSGVRTVILLLERGFIEE
jgi:hypothetical protein